MFAKFKTFLSVNKKALWISLMVAVVSGAIAIWQFSGSNNSTTATTTPTTTPTQLPSLLNGQLVSADIANRHPVAVMIENSQPARPQVGLTDADVVYEAVTEGGITRFMALYSTNFPTKVGPVRSARSYFINWLSPYDAFYGHAGGSPTALSLISSAGIKDAAGFNAAYHREPAPGVASEHTLFADVSKIFDIGKTSSKWPATFDFKPWSFKDPDKLPGPAGKVNVHFSSSPFDVVWDYVPATNSYNRNLAGAPHKDKVSGKQINVSTIIAITVSHSPNPPYSGTGKESEWTMSVTGTGAASLFFDGKQIKGTWSKATRTDMLKFSDSAGKEIVMNRGKIWVEVIPQDGTISLVASPATTSTTTP